MITVRAAEIDVQGNGASITDGDNSPSTGDDTDFGNVQLTDPALVQTFTIHNTTPGATILNITSVSLTGDASFTVGSLSPAGPIAPGGSATFTVSFDPSGTGIKTATINLISDDCDEGTYNFVVRGIGGTGLPAEIEVRRNGTLTVIANGDLTPDLADSTEFGTYASGTVVTRTYQVYNLGAGDLTITDITSSNPFFQLDPQAVPVVVPVGDFITLKVRYLAIGAGTRQTTITLVNDDFDETPYTFTLRGTSTAGSCN